MKEHAINEMDNFICGWYMTDSSICDKLISYHKTSDSIDGQIGNGQVNKRHKDSKDCALLDKDLFNEYAKPLLKTANLYSEKYPYCNAFHPWGLTEKINLQHYKPQGGFFSWHSERTGPNLPQAARHLVFMTYLNNVKVGGETEFFHQKVKVKPEKGLTLIWGSDWTFTHRGITSMSEDKYIATGWFSYMPRQETT